MKPWVLSPGMRRREEKRKGERKEVREKRVEEKGRDQVSEEEEEPGPREGQIWKRYR